MQQNKLIKHSQKERAEIKTIWLFLAIPVILLIVFGIWPILLLIWNSFTDWDGVTETKNFVGLANYLAIIKDPSYFEAFKTNLYYLVSGLVQIVIALILATFLTIKTRGKTFFKSVIVFPILISGVAVSMMFKLFFEPDGSFDQLLNFLGMHKMIRFWLGDPRIVNITLAFISLWRHLGTSFLLYFSAMQGIPENYLKTAELEGASLWQTVRLIILPNIQTVLKLNFILLIIGSVSAFEVPLIMTNGSNGTTTFLLKIMKVAFDQKMVGLGSALAVIMSIIILGLSLLQNRIEKTADNES